MVGEQPSLSLSDRNLKEKAFALFESYPFLFQYSDAGDSIQIGQNNVWFYQRSPIKCK